MSDRFQYASFWQRLLAHNIDLIPILGLYYSFSLLIPRSAFDFLWIGGLYSSYYIAFEASVWQATPGKKWTKLSVKNESHGRSSIVRIILRNLSKAFSLILFFSGFICILFNERRKGLHDYIGGTLVLFEED